MNISTTSRDCWNATISSCSIVNSVDYICLTLNRFMMGYIMAIDIMNDNIDFSDNIIDDLILADIRLNAISKELPNYQYEDACGKVVMRLLLSALGGNDAYITGSQRKIEAAR